MDVRSNAVELKVLELPAGKTRRVQWERGRDDHERDRDTTELKANEAIDLKREASLAART